MKIVNVEKLIAVSVLSLCIGFKSFASGASGPDYLFEMTGSASYKSPHNVQVSEAVNQSSGLSDSWWKESAFYHIWVKSFCDSDGDGCGDFKGIQQKLDYIRDTVGCDAIWLSPIFECSGKSKSVSENMHGYDVTDYYKVNDYFGTEQELEDLLKACHERGIKVIFDFVPNHTSPVCSWFTDSCASRNGKQDWYLWSDQKLFWKTNMQSSSWSQASGDDSNGRYYYGAFGSGMPDLNYRNMEVREEMKNVVRYWLNKGFDGVRIDAVRYLVESKEATTDSSESHKWFRELRREVIDAYQSPKFMVCEAWAEGGRTILDSYFGTAENPEFNMVFDFDQGHAVYKAIDSGTDQIRSSLRSNPAKSKAYGTFLGNHDMYEPRLGTRMGSDPKKIKLATALSLLRPTVPFIYYGNEIAEKNVAFGGDMSLRGPFDWNLAESEKAQETSVLKLNKALLSLRKTYSDCFADGKVTALKCPQGIYAYIIEEKNQKLLCVFNLTPSAMESAVLEGYDGTKSIPVLDFVKSVFGLQKKAFCLVGDTQSPAVVLSKDSVTVKNLAPFAFRVYDMNGSKQNVFDDETYIAGEVYKPLNDKEATFIASSSMYLRGSMNGWGGTKMERRTEGRDVIWSVTVRLDMGDWEYKFCINDSASWGANWGVPGSGDNIKFHADGGMYRIEFVENKGTSTIIKL